MSSKHGGIAYDAMAIIGLCLLDAGVYLKAGVPAVLGVTGLTLLGLALMSAAGARAP